MSASLGHAAHDRGDREVRQHSTDRRTGRDRVAPAGRVTTASRRNAALSLRRGVAMLSLVAEATREGRPGMTLGELAGALDVSKSTVLRLAAPLVEEDLLRRDGRGAFLLGLGSLLLGQSYLEGIDLRSAAAPFMRAAAGHTRHTCHLVIPDGTDVVYVDKVEYQPTVRMGSRVGGRMPMRNTSVGKAIIAASEPHLLEEVCAGPLTPRTPHTISTPEGLRAEIARTRERGYAIDDRENEVEVRCVGAPIFNYANQVVGALSISALVSRMPAAKVREYGEYVTKVGLQISVALGSESARLRLAAANRNG